VGGSGSGRYGSRRPIAEGLRRFDMAEWKRTNGNEWPNEAIAVDITIGKVHARAQLIKTATRFGGRRVWICCPRCDRRSRVLYVCYGRIACRRCFRLRYQSHRVDRRDRCLNAMIKIAKKIDPEADDPNLPDKPPGMHWSTYDRLAERHHRLDKLWGMLALRGLARFL
jgi:hypothetical protein